MNMAFLLYDDMTALDAIGPYEVLSRLPGAKIQFVAQTKGLVQADTKFLNLSADYSIDEITSADILMIPGGPGDANVRNNPTLLDWIRSIDKTTQFTISVCSGSLILGAAGLLDGLEATSHWTVLEELREYGAKPTLKRVVDQGRIITAAGVSSGIDMALYMLQKIAGDDLAQAVQLGIEYDPQPPLDAGSPEKAPDHIVQMVRATMTGNA